MKKLYTAAIISVCFLLFLLSCTMGRYPLSAGQIFNIVFGGETGTAADVFLKIRLPRTLTVFVGGGALAAVGFIYQIIFDNPLVSPDVLGVSSGCSVGAVTAILFFSGSRIAASFLPFGAGLAAVLISLLLSKLIGSEKSSGMVLAGIVVGALCNSAITTFKYTADPEHELSAIEYWLMGSFSNVLSDDAWSVCICVLIPMFILFLMRHKLKILSLGDDEAYTLGTNAAAVKAAAIILSTVMVAAVTSAAGIVSWIGLIVPHIVRRLYGYDPSKSFLHCFFCGAALLTLADIVCRCALSSEIPISIFTSFLGALFLAAVLIRQRVKRSG